MEIAKGKREKLKAKKEQGTNPAVLKDMQQGLYDRIYGQFYS